MRRNADIPTWSAASLLLLVRAFVTPAHGQSASCEPGDEYYFPSGVFEETYPSEDKFRRDWYSPHLRAMGESSLSCGAIASADEDYRFLWLRSFHQPVAVRVSRKGEVFTLTATVLSGAGGYEPGHVSRRIVRRLSSEDWRRISAAIEALKFWEMPTSKSEETGIDAEGDKYVLVHGDGAQWVLEGRSERYHVVDRWGGEGGIEAVGLLLLELAGIAPEPLY